MQAAPHRGAQVACKACGKLQHPWGPCLGVVYAQPTTSLAKRKLLQCVLCTPACYQSWCGTLDAARCEPKPTSQACAGANVILASNMSTMLAVDEGFGPGQKQLILPSSTTPARCASPAETAQIFLHHMEKWGTGDDALKEYLPESVHAWAAAMRY